MGTPGTVAVVVLVVAVLVAVGVVAYKLEQKRKAAMAAFAAEHGMRIVERDDGLLRRWRKQDPFDEGFDHEARNIITGTWDGRPATIFDYRYHTWETVSDGKGGSRQQKKSHDLAVVAIDGGQAYPDLRVKPEGVFGRAFGRLTNTDIQTEWEDFNRAFTVTCSNRRFASDVLHQQMMETLIQRRDLAWQFVGRDLMIVRPGKHDPENIGPTLQTVDAILDRLPEHVVRTDWSKA